MVDLLSPVSPTQEGRPMKGYDHGAGTCSLCNNQSFTWGTRNYKDANHSSHRLYNLRRSYCYLFRKEIPSTPPRCNHCYFRFAQDRLLVNAGYEWDGATWGRHTKNSFRATLIHDALYHSMRDGILPQDVRKWADDEFYYMLRDDEMSWLRAAIWWVLCRLGGWYYTKFAVPPPRAWPVRLL